MMDTYRKPSESKCGPHLESSHLSHSLTQGAHLPPQLVLLCWAVGCQLGMQLEPLRLQGCNSGLLALHHVCQLTNQVLLFLQGHSVVRINTRLGGYLTNAAALCTRAFCICRASALVFAICATIGISCAQCSIKVSVAGSSSRDGS